MRGAPALELLGFERRYGPGAQVGPISFAVQKGEFASLLGPSGCGKTTILRAIAGFEPVDRGAIRLDGRDLRGAPAHRRGVGLIFQNYALFPHLSVFDNVAFGLRLRRVPSAERRARVDAALALVGMADLHGRLPAALSGGQQQRVAIARSLVLEPELLLLDEPLSNLDARLRVQMRAELRSIQRRLGLTFLYVTHDQSEALALSDQLIVLSRGRLEQQGAPEEVYRRPRSRFIADFIGAANLLDATVAEAGAGWLRLRLAIGQIVTVSTPDPRQVGQPVWLCIRPEDLKPAGGGECGNRLAGRPLLTTFLGDRTEVQFALDGAGPTATLTFHVASIGELGDPMSVSFRPDAAIVLDPGP